MSGTGGTQLRLVLVLCAAAWGEAVQRDYLPQAAGSATVPPVRRMVVVRSETKHPFWICVPDDKTVREREESWMLRDVGVTSPSLSMIFHHVLAGQCVLPDGRRRLVIDAGAHLGWFSLLAASYGCRTVTIEPQPHIAPYFNASVIMNGFEDLISYFPGRAVSNVSGASMHMVNPRDWRDWDVSVLVDGDGLHPNSSSVPVTTVRIDDLVDEDVLIFKIDTEGHERHVLGSAEKLLSSREVGVFAIETKPETDLQWKKTFFQGLIKQGYSAAEFQECYNFVGCYDRGIFDWSMSSRRFHMWQLSSFENWEHRRLWEDILFSKQPIFEPPAGACEAASPVPLPHTPPSAAPSQTVPRHGAQAMGRSRDRDRSLGPL